MTGICAKNRQKKGTSKSTAPQIDGSKMVDRTRDGKRWWSETALLEDYRGWMHKIAHNGD